MLNELYPGEFERMIAACPELKDAYTGLFVERLRPILIELERVRVSVLLIARDVSLCALYAYFFDLSPKDVLGKVQVPENHLVSLRPLPFGTEVTLYRYDRETDSFQVASSRKTA